ncbi:HAMP domain-containing sensor histidine kinase [Hathewaya histolytica]|uniref:histidine kinase n=1 Tax=Hathewaya histolytica TaxID=1498 RepID=A0A4U9RSQ5_HATHI|nr:HAMP domain-containing sensor histidine kinase [Hathewaya histolytica]VTQ95444.1 sensory transduction histidine kinase [Hathewaya histolytica]
MKKRGLFTKMLATYTLIISLSFVILATFLSFWFETYYFKQRKEQLESQSVIISQLALRYIKNETTPESVEETLEFIGGYLNADIWIVDNWGYIYAVSNSSHKKLIGNQLFIKDIEDLKKRKIIEKKGTYGQIYNNLIHSIEIPIFTPAKEFAGAIIMNTPMTEITEPLNGVYEIIWISVILGIIISCIIIYRFSQRIIVKPLGEINQVARKISRGEVEKRVTIKADDEIGELASSFNYMADFLEKVEDNRRQFISNVSHEIRSPITSIKGFIGGIIDGIIPKEKERYYLKLAYEEIQRLTRLVNELLDLSALQDGKFKLIVEDVDINEIIRVTVLKFETKIREKDLKVDVCFDNDKLLVVADKDRLVQVITNLLDNAIKYSKDEAEIKINCKSKSKKAIISIYNESDPIPEDTLNKLWERFYRGDKSRTAKVSTGLGLSIVREILSQLNQEIWAQNIDKGVCFSFTLDKSKKN